MKVKRIEMVASSMRKMEDPNSLHCAGGENDTDW
jgi:hypothetical protein